MKLKEIESKENRSKCAGYFFGKGLVHFSIVGESKASTFYGIVGLSLSLSFSLSTLS